MLEAGSEAKVQNLVVLSY
uniref:Uncharacterized protein n=1 Tax=Anguilla anguilla TaxID=7936 RepID=A0A0E9VR56_ANGAN